MVSFLTVPDELTYLAVAAHEFYAGRGYACEIEPKELEYPERPGFSAELAGETTICVICSHADMKNVKRWIACARSMTTPTKLVLVMPEGGVATHLADLRQEGVGLIAVSDDSRPTDILNGRDLTFQIALPDISEETRDIRRALAHSYEKFDAGDWRDAFEEACICLENAAREYFTSHVQSGRIVTLKKSGVDDTPTIAKIERMTIGQLYNTFARTKNITSKDQLLVDTLQKINPDRVAIVHKRRRNEQQARTSIGADMHAIVNCLRVIL